MSRKRNKNRLEAPQAPLQATPPPVVTTPENTSTFAFATPTEFVELPSGGRFYTEEHPLHSQDTIEINFMTAKEEDILTSPALLKKGIAIERLLESVVVDKTLDLDSLLVGDKNALLVATRVTGYGGDYNTNVVCPICVMGSQHVFDLSEVNHTTGGVSDVNEEFVTSGPDGTFFITGLERTQATVQVRLLRGKDEKATTARLKTKKKHNVTASRYLEQLSSFIVSVNDTNDPTYIASFLENLPALDSRHLRTVYASLVPNVDLRQEFECGSCGGNSEVEVPLTAEFFWPR